VKCHGVHSRLSAYMDGELDAALSGEVEAHLKQCPDCREVLEELRSADVLLRDLPRYSLPAKFAKALLSRLQDQEMKLPEKGPRLLHRVRQALLEVSARFFELLEPVAPRSTRSLEEFNDVPESFIGSAYFRILGSQR
jgi:anti-sigma factor RsiW